MPKKIILFLLMIFVKLNLVAQSLTPDEIDGITRMREEEKLARDVYKKLYDKWKINSFINIYESEITHMNAVLTLIQKYNLQDPAAVDEPGKFSNKEIQKLYIDLTTNGLSSEQNAIVAGLTIEDLDIKDLNILIAKTKNSDIIRVYNELLKGSRNHMRSFYNQAKKYNIKYTPAYISKKEFDDIINSRQEKGRN